MPRRHLLEKAIVQREVRHEALQPCVLLLQALEPLRLIDSSPAVLLLPPIVGLLGDAQLATRADHGKPFAHLNLDRPQMAMISSAVFRVRAMPSSVRRLESSLQT